MSRLDKALQALLLALNVASSVFIKNPKSQDTANKFLNLGTIITGTITSLRSTPQ